MHLNRIKAGWQRVNSVRVISSLTLALTLLAGSTAARAQAANSVTVEPKADGQSYETLYLSSSNQRNDDVDIVTDLRNMLPKAKVYYVPPQNAISIMGTQDDFRLARKILADMNRAMSSYRLTYTITETEGSQQLGTQRVTLIVAAGSTTEIKQGSRMPIVTGVSDAGASNMKTEVQYLDIGLNIKASLDGSPDHLGLRTTVEESSIEEQKSGAEPQDAVIRQTTLSGTSTLTQGKPVVLGSIDLPGGERQMEIEVTSEPIP